MPAFSCADALQESAIGGKAGYAGLRCTCPLLTQSGHSLGSVSHHRRLLQSLAEDAMSAVAVRLLCSLDDSASK